MQYRDLGRTGYRVSTISLGAWAFGGSWGEVRDEDSMATLHRACDLGVNFIDTADVYGDGRSERLVARLRRERSERIYVATKAGRRLPEQTVEGYSLANLTRFVERSLANLEMDCLDLLQLHCPPAAIYDRPEVFEALEALVQAGKVAAYGVSVETVDEARRALAYPNVQTIQIIYNAFRLRPRELFPELRRRGVGVLARVPLASGLLSGRMSRATTFSSDDHRAFNRHGEAFDVGETFSGVDFEQGLAAVEELREIVPEGVTLAQFALRFILMDPAVTCAIPGAKRPSQVEDNVAAADLPSLSDAAMRVVEQVYDRYFRAHVHHRW